MGIIALEKIAIMSPLTPCIRGSGRGREQHMFLPSAHALMQNKETMWNSELLYRSITKQETMWIIELLYKSITKQETMWNIELLYKSIKKEEMNQI